MVKYVGLHIHKCAGTTLQIHFEEHLNDKFRSTSPDVNLNNGLYEIENLSRKAKSYVAVNWGHEINENLFYDDPSKIYLFTFLRDPVERLLSWYFYEKKSYGIDTTFAEFISSRSNSMCNMVIRAFPSLVDKDMDSLSGRAISALEKFAFVGFQNSFTHDSQILLNRIGLPFIEPDKRANTGKKKEKKVEQLSKEDLLAANELNLEDKKLYEHFRSKESIKFDESKVVSFFKEKLNEEFSTFFLGSQLAKLRNQHHDFVRRGNSGDVFSNKLRFTLEGVIWLYLSSSSDSEKRKYSEIFFYLIKVNNVKINESVFNKFFEVD